MPSGQRRSKPPFRRNEVIAYIRDRIVDGRYPPGSRLPTRMEVAQAVGAPPLTVQDAFDALVLDGFVAVASRRGTFVADRPPCHHRIVMIFTEYPKESSWGEFWTRLDHCLRSIAARRGLNVDIRYGIRRGTPDAQQLIDDVEQRRVAGLVFTSSPHPIAGTPVLTHPGMARVIIGAHEDRPEIQGVVMDTQRVLELALDHFHAAGCRRCAMVLPIPHLERYESWLMREFTRRGMAAEPWLLQPQNADQVRHVDRLAWLLARLGPKDRPDGLYIGDDNLVVPLIRALADGGLSIGPDLVAVAHANFPLESNVVAGVKRVGFSIPELLELALDGILAEMNGRRSGFQHAHARYDHELDDEGRSR